MPRQQHPPTPHVSSYHLELSAYRDSVAKAVERGSPVLRLGHRLHWIPALLGLPIQLILAKAYAIRASMEWLLELIHSAPGRGGILAVFLAILRPAILLSAGLSRVLVGATSGVDVPFRTLRKRLHETTRDDPKPDRQAASHLRISHDAWPALESNVETMAQIRTYLKGSPSHRYEVILVPGYANDRTVGPLSGRAKERLDRAAQDFREGVAPFVVVSGGNVHPPGTPFNEAFEMRRYLIDTHGVEATRILVEPLARHSTTNLRNAGRLMKRLGLRKALITTSPEPFRQTHYFQCADLPGVGLHARCMREIGLWVGDLHAVDRWHTCFTPSDEVSLVRLETGGRAPSADP